MPILAFSTEFYTILYITIGVIIVKAILSFLLSKKALIAKKEGLQSFQFIGSIAILMICLVISRIFLVIFDFYLTRFDLTTYTINKNVWIWKIGGIFANLGLIPVSYIVDKKILQGKFKGILALWIFIWSIVVLVYPVNVFQDFEIASTFLMVSNLGALIVPGVFIKMIRDTTGTLKSYAILFLVGLIMYILAALIVNAAILTRLNTLFGQGIEITLYSLQAVFKIVGLVMFSFATTRLAI
jgi:hypothetical protein